jgi:hypothetical protein
VEAAVIERDILIVCTGQGRHPQRSLAHLVRVEAGNTRVPEEVRRRGFHANESVTRTTPTGQRATERAEVHISDAGTVHVPACPTCGRAPRITADQLAAVSAHLPSDPEGRVTLDISRIPN